MSRRQKIRFVIILAGFALALLFTYHENVLGNILSPLTLLTARVTLTLIHVFGMEATQIGTLIYHPDGFTYEIYYRCTGFLPVTVLAVLIFAHPGPSRFKFLGLVLGIPILLALNLLRLVYLFFVGVCAPALFDFAHSVIGQSLLILATAGLWLTWVKCNASAQKIWVRSLKRQ